MGGNTSVPTLPPKPPERDFDRNFILLGKVNSGKSTLANLLLGCVEDIQFPVHPRKQPAGCTKSVSNKETKVASCIVFGDNFTGSDSLKIQITDQPGSNDVNFSEAQSCKHILQCIKESRVVLSDTFLIVCDISGKFFSNEELISILNISEILSHSGYMFLQNAILVFSHADKFGNPEDRLKEIIQTEEWVSIQKLLQSINNRYLFINSTDKSEGNRNTLIKRLFELSKPTLNVVIIGNNGFPSSEFRDFLNLHDNTLIQKQSEQFNVEYFFNPNLNIFHSSNKHTMDQGLGDELKKLLIISKGISVVVVLISLEEAFTGEFSGIINQIPNTFSIQRSEKIEDDPLWKYSFIVFLSPVDDKNLITQDIKSNSLLVEVVSRVNNRFTWVTRGMQPDECYRRLINMVLKVSQDSQGTSLINGTIASEIISKIKASNSVIHPRTQKNIPYFETNQEGLWIGANTFNWNKEDISNLLAYFIIKKEKPEAAATFLEIYPDSEKNISKEDFKKFCLEHLK